MAWTPARVSAAPTCSDSWRTRKQSRAAIVPMLTLSWLCDSVEREKDAAGIVALRASAASADDAIDMALKPWRRP